MIAIIGLVIGVVIGVVLQPDVPVALQPYLPIAVVAALDTLAGGLRATLDGAFDSHVFITSFLFNVLLRSEEHTSELQSRGHLVCRLLLEKKKKTIFVYNTSIKGIGTDKVGRQTRGSTT